MYSSMYELLWSRKWGNLTGKVCLLPVEGKVQPYVNILISLKERTFYYKEEGKRMLSRQKTLDAVT